MKNRPIQLKQAKSNLFRISRKLIRINFNFNPNQVELEDSFILFMNHVMFK